MKINAIDSPGLDVLLGSNAIFFPFLTCISRSSLFVKEPSNLFTSSMTPIASWHRIFFIMKNYASMAWEKPIIINFADEMRYSINDDRNLGTLVVIHLVPISLEP